MDLVGSVGLLLSPRDGNGHIHKTRGLGRGVQLVTVLAPHSHCADEETR